ncbi:MAG: NAD-dependent epimerase/dehydratase family protein, partial [Planctomycetes bacterium]|nr:NAD-dependent epimerase/dehydratase family protein [Planctomycetota bacterium]
MDRIDFSKNRSVLLTGAGGFIGAHLAAFLEKSKVDLSLLIRKGGEKTATAGRPALPAGVRIFEGDLCDPPSLNRAIHEARPALVFHLAALTDVRRDPVLETLCRRINFEGTMNLVGALKNTGLVRMIHLGTCEEYGKNPAPFSEEMAVHP